MHGACHMQDRCLAWRLHGPRPRGPTGGGRAGLAPNFCHSQKGFQDKEIDVPRKVPPLEAGAIAGFRNMPATPEERRASSKAVKTIPEPLRRSRGRPAAVSQVYPLLGDIMPPTREDEDLVESYYRQRGSLVLVARELGRPVQPLFQRRETDTALAAVLDLVDEIIRDEVHAQFMQKVLDPAERMPAWKIFYLKNRDRRYAERPKPSRAVRLTIGDRRFANPPTDVVEAEVVAPPALTAEVVLAPVAEEPSGA